VPTRAAAVLSAVAVLLLPTAAASAHETKPVGALRMTIGWTTEPAYSGFDNAVEVAFVNLDGTPIGDGPSSLAVDVSFGAQRTSLALAPAGRPGLFRARMVPTRAGSYSFHVSGKVVGETIDVTSNCSGATFDCVTDAAELQFPAKDPPSGQLLTRLDRERARADHNARDAASARRFAFIAIGLAAVALVVSIRRRSA
jgi:hypothetical protein